MSDTDSPPLKGRRITIRDLRSISRIPTPTQMPTAPRPSTATRRADFGVTAPWDDGRKPPKARAKQPTPPRVPGTKKTKATRARHRRWEAKRDAALRPQAEALLIQLQARWPLAFAKGWPKPLALGIHHAIRANLGCDPQALSVVMRLWCGQAAYLANVVDGTHRHGLDGEPAAELTPEEREAARTRLEAMQAAYKQRARGKARKATA